ncbi:MAG TPA: ATP-binding protein [Acetobacteraceae bacterium]|nr:ATP-binding protein [Acetobacteraceae bacterium]
MSDPDPRRARAAALHLHGLLAHWPEVIAADWVVSLLGWEEQERHRRSLERRLKEARIGRFKPLCDFDWSWPKRCDRAAVEALMALDFLKEAANVVLVGPNGVGKSTLAQNIAHQALIEGHTVLFTSAGQLLGDLCALDSDSALRRRLRHYARPELLVIDEVGYLSYSNRHADLMFELVSRRYQTRSTVITTNRPFAEWHEVFPNAACVVSLLERRRGDQGGWCITPRSSPSRANPTASRRRASAPNNAPASVAAANHEHPLDAGGVRSHPSLVDARAGAGRAGIAQRPAGCAVCHPWRPHPGHAATRTGLRRQGLAVQRTRWRQPIVLSRSAAAGLHQPPQP